MSRQQMPRKGQQPGEHTIDPLQWVERHGDYLYRYALRLVRKPDAAEDLVQETLLVAWRGRDQFAGRAQERSWLTAILKRKVIDWLRKRIRERDRLTFGEADSFTDDMFSKSGKWKKSPKRWNQGAPETESDREEFWETIHACSDKLPLKLRDAFVLWHLEDQSSAEVCQKLKVRPTHLWVILHRARLRMWHCLSKKWYGLETP